MYLEIREVCRRRLWKRISRSIGAPLKNLERALFYRSLRETDEELWKRSVSPCGSSTRGSWREGSFTRDPQGYSKGRLRKRASFSIRSPMGNLKGVLLLGTLTDGRKRVL